jgi:hypothetical protein
MELHITPPIPTRRGFVLTDPGAEVIVEEMTGPIRWDHVKTGFANGSGEFYFPVTERCIYRAISQGEALIRAAHPLRIFNSTFNSPLDETVWRTRGTTYLKGSSDYAKADSQCASVENGKLILRVMEGEKDGTFLTGHVGTGEIGQPARFAFTHGWASAKMTVHPLWGATSGFWLQGMEGYAPGHGEIDVMEWGGRKNLTGKSGFTNSSIWHTPEGGDHPVQSGPIAASMADMKLDPVAKPVVFTVNWQADFYDFWINTRRIGRITDGLSSQPKFLVSSILVRNFQLDDILENLGKIATYKSSTDWIRVWR